MLEGKYEVKAINDGDKDVLVDVVSMSDLDDVIFVMPTIEVGRWTVQARNSISDQLIKVGEKLNKYFLVCPERISLCVISKKVEGKNEEQ